MPTAKFSAELEIRRMSPIAQAHRSRAWSTPPPRRSPPAKMVGWFQGRMEFGPRALGNRSILADPRRTDMKDTAQQPHQASRTFPALLPFRPGRMRRRFLRNQLSLALHGHRLSHQARSLRDIPAVTHADGTGRLQTVDREIQSALLETHPPLRRPHRRARSC